jgi:hypothetical protein
MKRHAAYLMGGLALLAFVAIVPITTRAQDVEADHRGDHHGEKFTVDASLDTTTVGPVGKSLFVRGELLVVNGNLFPGGTLPTGLNGGNDPNAPGQIGKILCRAAFLIDSTDFTTPFATFVSELYSFPDDVTHLLADGLGPNPGTTAHRIVSGGTGRYRGMVGELDETNLGLNAIGGCNLRLTFKLRKVEREHHDR